MNHATQSNYAGHDIHHAKPVPRRASASRRIIALLACSALIMMTIGCLAPKTSDKDVNTVTAKQYDAMLAESKNKVAVVDVRQPADYAKGHLPGAINIPLPELVANDRRLAEATHIIVYSSGWADPLSIAAAKRMIVLRYANVYDFPGGTELWQAENRQLEK